MKDFSRISAPLTRLIRKQVKFEWDDTCEQSFQKLKNCLTTAPVLALPTDQGGMTVHCDASRVGLGCVLMQKGESQYGGCALSRKSMGSLAHISVHKRSIVKELRDLFDMGVQFEVTESQGLVAQFQVRPLLIDEIKANQDKDPSFIKLRETVQSGHTSGFEIRDGVLRRGNRLCVPDVDGLRQRILQEAHNAPYIVHPGVTKMYLDVKGMY